MEVRAAVAHAAGKPLTIETVRLEGPREGEVLVDYGHGHLPYRRLHVVGGDPKASFLRFWVTKAQVLSEVGAGVSSLAVGDHVIPLYTPVPPMQILLIGKTNLCGAIRDTQGPGLMPDGNSRFSMGGTPFSLHGYIDLCQFHRRARVARRIRSDAPFDKVCYIGCGVTTGIGAVMNTAKVEAGATVSVFGLGGIGLNVIQGARMAGASASSALI